MNATSLLSNSPVWTALGAALAVAIAAGHRRLASAIQRPPVPPPRLATYPSVTVIRPIRGLDTGARENAEALLDQVYPGALETLFVLDSEADPAYPVMVDVVRSRRAAGPLDADVLVAGTPPQGRTGKLHAMMFGEARAKGELVVFCDSDTRPDPDLLRIMVEELLARPHAGCTFAPVVARSEAPTAADVAYELLVNAWYGASVAVAAGERGELPFIMGQIMVFTRPALAAVGGVRCAEGQFVDDMYIGRCLARAGFANVMVPYPLHIVTGGLGLWQFVRVFRRWILFSDGGLPPAFVRVNWLRGVLYFMALGAAVGAVVTAGWGAALGPLVAMATFVWSQIALQRRLGGAGVAVRHLWVPGVLPLVSALVALSTKLDREVDWRGRRYVLDGTAKLAR